MKNILSISGVLGLLLVGESPAFGNDCEPNGREAQQLVVRLAEYADFTTFLDTLHQQYPDITPGGQIPGRPIYRLDVGLTHNDDQVELYLQQLVNPNPNVVDPSRPLRWAEFNEHNEASEGQTGSIFVNVAPTSTQLYAQQYGLSRQGFDAAHSVVTGFGVVVAVLDTGIDASQPALAGHIASGGFNFVTGTADTSDAGNQLDDDGDSLTDEMVGHGTFVAGLIALTAPDAGILPITVLNSDGIGDEFVIAQGIYYAIDSGANVINLSLSSRAKTDLIEGAVTEANTRGIVIVAAAGNSNTNSCEEYPAMSGEVIGVAAVDDHDLKASFSNYNQKVALSACGTSVPMSGGPDGWDPERTIYSTVPSGYAAWAGTSMSTAFVSGAAALVLQSLAPGARPHCSIGAQGIESLLCTSSVIIDPLNPPFAGELGSGRLDVEAAVNAALTILPGDYNLNRRVDLTDLGLLLSAYGTADACTDLTGDGFVNLPDLGILLSNFGM